jgi:hypothetical protein
MSMGMGVNSYPPVYMGDPVGLFLCRGYGYGVVIPGGYLPIAISTSSHWFISAGDGRTGQSGTPPDSHVHCPMRATSAQSLGSVDRWGALSSCCTGQSGATPDSPVTSDFGALTFARHCSSLLLLQRAVGAPGAVAPVAHQTVR